MREPYLGDVSREETDNFMKFMDIYLILRDSKFLQLIPFL